MKKRVEAAICLCIVVCLLVVCSRQGSIQLPDDDVPMDSLRGLVVEGERDQMIIPDKYNSGCDETKIVNEVSEAGKYGGLNFRLGSGGTVLAVDFVYGNSDVEDKIIIRDTDFSKMKIEFRNGPRANNKKELIFENCKFGSIRTDDASGNVSYIFKRCNVTNFGGSCATFEACYFGGKANDALNPLQNVTLNNCYIADLSHAGEGVVHVDGTQIFGRKAYDARNITYKNCRVEAPSLKRSGSNSGCYVNACLMVALEFNNGNNMLFEDCIINGGGYSIYGHANPGYELNNVVFRNIQVGNAHVYGNIYYRTAPTVKFDNVYDADSLYVASVWKENGKIHLSVSNDTKDERTLVVVTESGKEEFVIPACPNANDVPEDTPFEDMPFDIDIEVPDSGWVICYDGYEHTGQQIRFVNWSGENVFRQEAVQAEDSALDTDNVLGTDNVIDVGNVSDADNVRDAEETIPGMDQIAMEGSCGKDVTYKLDESGLLVISGTGSMKNFSSGNPAPWKDYKENIKKVVVEEGVTSIGSQAFNGYKKLEEIVLPSTLEVINSNSFQNCSLLSGISIPRKLTVIKERAFIGTGITSIIYEGDAEEFQKIEIGNYNAPILNATIEYRNAEDGNLDATGTEAGNEEFNIEGECGKNVSYRLVSDGTLTIFGEGAMTNFSSGKPAPWKDYKENIKRVVVEEGVTSIGSQSFNGYKSLESIDFPDTLEIINSNAFQNCSLLAEISIPKNVTAIKERAFIGTKIATVIYAGDEEAFRKIAIGSYNDPIINSVIEYRNEEENGVQ